MENESEMKWWRKSLRGVGKWLAIKNKDEWLKDMRGNLSLVATVMATMTFQSATNPPGGVRPANETGEIKCEKESCPGKAILADVYPRPYTNYFLFNTICFVSSLAVCLLLVSGFPLNNRFFTWLLSIAMCITITSLTITYYLAAQMVIPEKLWNETFNVFYLVFTFWISLLGLVTFVLCLRLIVWIVTKCIAKRKP